MTNANVVHSGSLGLPRRPLASFDDIAEIMKETTVPKVRFRAISSRLIGISGSNLVAGLETKVEETGIQSKFRHTNDILGEYGFGTGRLDLLTSFDEDYKVGAKIIREADLLAREAGLIGNNYDTPQKIKDCFLAIAKSIHQHGGYITKNLLEGGADGFVTKLQIMEEIMNSDEAKLARNFQRYPTVCVEGREAILLPSGVNDVVNTVGTLKLGSPGGEARLLQAHNNRRVHYRPITLDGITAYMPVRSSDGAIIAH